MMKDRIPGEFHEDIGRMYSWKSVAQRTERVYDRIFQMQVLPPLERLKRYYGTGVWCGKIFVCLWVLGFLLWMFFEWLQPASEIDPALPLPPKAFNRAGASSSSSSSSKNTVQ
jgi:phosphatidylinositol glycan class A protein